ncbi:phosphatidylserine decarboxylase [Bacillus salitolerans]|uniref:Phosphatidylserine decarboxylase proenzyme n=1 Tax=Bacillus salitolerans TaxID=1437434 RepID=A0ABW4LPF7_9BACI
MKKHLYRLFIELTNRPFISKQLERFAKSSKSRFIIGSFVRTYNIRLDEMEKPLHEYHSLHDLFTRKLKGNVRSIELGESVLVSPVDAVLEEYGEIHEDQTFLVKGKNYFISEMLVHEEKIDKYVGGSFMILYLSPSHYHRIHAPITGRITEQWSLGTSSYPVNRLGVKYGKSPFTKNYRVISEINHNGVHVAVVKVGAMFVNGIELIHKGEEIKKGEEIGYFSFGSTIILLFEKGSFTINPSVKRKMELKVGEKLGTLKEAIRS